MRRWTSQRLCWDHCDRRYTPEGIRSSIDEFRSTEAFEDAEASVRQAEAVERITERAKLTVRSDNDVAGQMVAQRDWERARTHLDQVTDGQYVQAVNAAFATADARTVKVLADELPAYLQAHGVPDATTSWMTCWPLTFRITAQHAPGLPLPNGRNCGSHQPCPALRPRRYGRAADNANQRMEAQVRLEKADVDFGTNPLARRRLEWQIESHRGIKTQRPAQACRG